MKQVVYAPGTVKRLSIAVAINKVLTDSEKEEVKNLIQSAAGIDFSRGDAVSVSGLQFEGANIDKQAQEDFTKQYQQEQLFYFIGTSVVPLVVVLVLGGFALLVLRNFVAKMPSAKRIERRIEEIADTRPEEVEQEEEIQPVQATQREIKSQKEQSISELNEAVMAAPEEAAKLLVSYIKD